MSRLSWTYTESSELLGHREEVHLPGRRLGPAQPNLPEAILAQRGGPADSRTRGATRTSSATASPGPPSAGRPDRHYQPAHRPLSHFPVEIKPPYMRKGPSDLRVTESVDLPHAGASAGSSAAA
ncbi:hypothetical protein F5X99DRAFT_406233 [Biscogniauxia marginata]|nr:hypothetical protein F5X99DRAFT_406233 [Biscogniauxia marginata]